jgi:hypothetical protein
MEDWRCLGLQANEYVQEHRNEEKGDYEDDCGVERTPELVLSSIVNKSIVEGEK